MQKLLLRVEVDAFNTRYAAILDRGDLSQWPALFANDPIYRITSRENFDAGLPIGLIYCDSRAMLEDRVASIKNTMVYSPRNILHFISNVEIDGDGEAGEALVAQANYLLVENMIDRDPRLLMAGRYLDKFLRDGDRLLLKERLCIYDTLLIQTSVVMPV